MGDGGEIGAEGQEQEDEGSARVSAAAAGVLRFSTERDPATVAAFVRLRVIDPEHAYRRRDIAAAQRWLRETRSVMLSVPVAYWTPQAWTGPGPSYPLGAWLADQRRYYAAGTLEAERVVELETLGMVWSVYTEWDGMLAVARAYAAAHGHFVPPATAVWEGQPIGTWAKNQRQAARKAAVNAARRAAGESGVPSTGSCQRAAGRRWKRSTRGGARCGMRDGSGPTGCVRHTSAPAARSLTLRARSSCRAKTSEHGRQGSAPGGTGSCPHSNTSWRPWAWSPRPPGPRRRRGR
nr:hypothetical protein StreXyl84_64030 [Streptomyces sp. Xyl84]